MSSFLGTVNVDNFDASQSLLLARKSDEGCVNQMKFKTMVADMDYEPARDEMSIT